MDSVPDLRPICFWGRMIWQLSELLVLGMGWSRKQMVRTTRPTWRTLPGKYEGSPMTNLHLATSPSDLIPTTLPPSMMTSSTGLFSM